MKRFIAYMTIIACILVFACSAKTSVPQGIYGSTVKMKDTWFCKKYGCVNDGNFIGKALINEDWVSYRPDSKTNPRLDKEYRRYALGISRDLQKRITNVALQTPATTASRGLSDEENSYIRDWIKLILGFDIPREKVDLAQDGTRDSRSEKPRTKSCTEKEDLKDIECINDITLYIMLRGKSNTKIPKSFTIYWKYIYGGGYNGNPTDDWMYIGIAKESPVRF
jgi:hypothetical protein